MGLTFSFLESDAGIVGLETPMSDGKAAAELVIGLGMAQFAWLRESGVWLHPIGQMTTWQPARRAHRAFSELAVWLDSLPSPTDDQRHLAHDVAAYAVALRAVVERGATETRVDSDGRSDVLEKAASGRSTCRVCGELIAAASLRFGEDVPGFGSLTWHHLPCGATKGRAFLRALARSTEAVPDREALEATARAAMAETGGAVLERAPTGRAKCFVCKKTIAKGDLRLRSSEYSFEASGPREVFTELACAPKVLEGLDGKDAGELVAWLERTSAAKGDAPDVDWSAVGAIFEAAR